MNILERRQLHYYYFAATAKFNEEHFDACTDERIIQRQKLYQHAGEPWEGDNVTLRADLVRAMRNLKRFVAGRNSDCPLDYSLEEVDECFRLESEQQLSDEDLKKFRQCLGVSIDGWVPKENYTTAKYQSEQFKAGAIALAESEEVATQIRRHWLFDDFEEDE